MSSTNKTTNLELSQFLGSDSPKWLTDYNADMEKIDAGYQTVKAQADATDLIVSGHTSSITSLQSTVTEQGTAITGLRTDVTTNSGSINTINSLIGNGTPTTSNQTVIGAINAIESSIAPSEDSDTLGANYATGALFARGGVVYEALTNLTSGTAFTSLTLNTDYKVADTLVEQIADIADDLENINGYVIKQTAWHTSVDLGVAGTDTFQDLYDAIIDKIGDILDSMESTERLIIDSVLPEGLGTLTPSERYHYVPTSSHPSVVLFDRVFPGSTQIVLWVLRCEKTSPKFEWSRIATADGTVTAGTYAATDLLSTANITSASLKYTIYKPVK